MGEAHVLHGDSLEVLKDFPDNSIDSIVTDPPYGLSFMGKKWDYDVPSKELWAEVLRVLKPGGHLLSFGGTRTYHRMVVAVEDAGFEIRDQIQWLYGSGFPKSHNLPGGLGTALKPANEPIVLARKPLVGTVAQNVAEHGTGALNIDASRIGFNESENIDFTRAQNGNIYGGNGIYGEAKQKEITPTFKPGGRWPANIILDEEAAAALDEQAGERPSRGTYKNRTERYEVDGVTYKFGGNVENKYANEKGGASRFFYVAKVSKRERNAGLEGMPEQKTWTDTRQPNSNDIMTMKRVNSRTGELEDRKDVTRSANHHPTVKPIALMEYLIRLITPPGGVVLDPFLGSGSTGCAAVKLGFSFIGIEREAQYIEIAEKRIKYYEGAKVSGQDDDK